MDSNNLNRWLTLGANIAVVAGIIFLAVEIRQNNDQLATQIAINQHQIRVEDIGRVVVDESLAAAQVKLLSGDELTDVERHRLSWMYATRFVNWELAYSLGRLEARGPMQSFGETPLSIEFWREYTPYLEPKFVEYIEKSVLAQQVK